MVFRSSKAMGVPVKPIYVALGRASRTLRALPMEILPVLALTFSSNPYWLLWASSAMTTIFFRTDNGSSISSNFCMVVKMIPLAVLPSSQSIKPICFEAAFFSSSDSFRLSA